MTGDEGGPALDVVIVSYRCRELLRRCLGSLREHPPSGGIRAIVVDNASGDGTAEMVRSEFAQVELRESPANIGFGAATNLGARLGNSPYLLALNPDTQLSAGALDALLATIEARPEVGVVGPRLLREDGSPDHAARRSFPTILSALGHFSGLGRRAGSPGRLAAYTAPDVESGPVDAVNGAFMLMRREAFEAVGGFDERYWMYMEDLDLCYRLKQAGWVTWYEPSATVTHTKAGTSGPNRSARLELAFHSGMYRFYRDHYAGERPLPLNALVYLGIGLRLVASVVQSSLRRSLDRLRQRRRSVEMSAGGSGSASGGG